MPEPSITPPFTLRPYQLEALAAIDRHLARGLKRLIIAIPTGTGKSAITAQPPQRLGTPFLLLAHRKELIDQHAVHMARANPGLTIGIEQEARHATGAEDIIIASIPTIIATRGRRLHHLTRIPWRAVTVDEGHHAPSPTWLDTLTTLRCFHPNGPPLIGTTATPSGRSDGVGLHTIFQTIAYQRSLAEMIQQGWLADLRAFTIHSETNLTHVHTTHGDFNEQELADHVNTPQRNALLVETWTRLAQGRRTLVFAVNQLHAEAIALSFRRAGFAASSLTHALPDKERERRLTVFKANAILILTSIWILIEGYDDPGLSCLLLARPTQSALLFAQIIGRGARLGPGKTDCLILDIVDTSSTHQIQTVAGLFGLPAHLNLKGRSALMTAQQIEAAISDVPTLDPHQFATADDLLAQARRLTLTVTTVNLVPTVAPEVANEARLTWIKLPSGHYHLFISTQTSLRIRQNLLDQWEVLLLPDRTPASTHPSRHEAFTAAEATIARLYPDRWRLALQRATWRSRPPSTDQLRILSNADTAQPQTRGEASYLIDQLTAQRNARWHQPATDNQRWYLMRHNAWTQGMTKGEARTLIQQIKETERATAPHPNQ